MADLRTKVIKKEGITIENTNKGKAILDRAWKAQGFDKIENHQVYSYKGKDTWKGMMGQNGESMAGKEIRNGFQISGRNI